MKHANSSSRELPSCIKFGFILQSRVLLQIMLLLLFGCTQKKIHNDFKIPRIRQRIYKKPTIEYPKGWSRRVSFNIAPGTEVTDVLKELAIQVKINVNIDQLENANNISYKVTNMPFLKAIKQICRLCKWKISINQVGDLSITKDEPYVHEHEVAFLSNMRSIKSSANITAINQRSDDQIGMEFRSENEMNLWDEIKNNLTFLLKDENIKEEKVKYSINKQAGLIIAKATQAEHEKIASFLRKIHVRAASQVLIEARIVEIELFDEFIHGINWDLAPLAKQLAAYDSSPQAKADLFSSMANGLTFLARFGKARTLSNPRTAVLNNQHAIFKAVTNKIYFKLNSSYGSYMVGKAKIADQSLKMVNSEVHTVPIGIIFIVQPSINFDNDTISLHIRPTVSAIESMAADPAVTLMGGKSEQQVPITKESSIDTVIIVKDKEMAVVGGLIRRMDEPGEFGIKKGSFVFKGTTKNNQEIVILVQATILRPDFSQARMPLQAYEVLDLDWL